jgi:hypothetical protein
MTDGNSERWRSTSIAGCTICSRPPPRGWQVNVHDSGEVGGHLETRVTVTAIPVVPACGGVAFRVQTRDKTIVISGDARRARISPRRVRNATC